MALSGCTEWTWFRASQSLKINNKSISKKREYVVKILKNISDTRHPTELKIEMLVKKVK